MSFIGICLCLVALVILGAILGGYIVAIIAAKRLEKLEKAGRLIWVDIYEP